MKNVEIKIHVDIPAIKALASALEFIVACNSPAPFQEAAAAVEKTEAITLGQVRAKLAALTQGGKQAEVKALIEKYGGAKLSDIPKDKYSDLMKEAEGV